MAEFSSIRPEAANDSLRVPGPGDVIAGKYRVEGVVGTGGMGMVLSAQHLRLGQSVAIKVLTMAGISESRRHEAQARFLREAQAAAGLSSDHVVRVFDVGTLDSGVPYMVMELLAGSDLSGVLEREGPLPIDRAVDYVAQACDAIAEAHARGIVHRDLKPSNLFLTRKKDGRTTIKVLDFGISKAVVGGEDPLDGNLTATRSVVGSPYYMSPEQVRDAKRVDTRTDVWSLGMILYELLIGAPAFDAETLPGICAAIVADPPPPIRMTRRDVPIELEGVILRCLEKNPAQRFPTVEALQQALIPFLPASALARISGSTTGSGLLAVRELATSYPDGRRSLSREHAAAPDVPNAFELDRTAPGSDPAPAPAAVAATSASAEPATGKDGGRRSPAVLFGVALTAVLAAGAYGWFASRTPAATPARSPAARASASPVEPASFTLTIESTPPGAQVLEGERVLGTTPLALPIEAASVRAAPRQLWVQRDGHAPYHIVQGPSRGDVKVVAALSPLPSMPAPASAEPAAEAAPEPADDERDDDARRSSSSARRRARRAEAGKVEPSAPLPDPSEIRLER